MKRHLLLCILAFCSIGAMAQAPVITTNIYSTTACATSGETFLYIGASNVSSYTWQVSTNGGGFWTTVVSGTYYLVDGSIFYIFPVDSMDFFQYRCIVANSNGSDTSNTATLFLTASAPSTPIFVNPPTEVCQGSTVPIEVTNATNELLGDTVFWEQTSTASFSPNYLVNDTNVLVHFSTNAASQSVGIFEVSNGCGANYYYSTPISTPITVNPLQSTPAGTAGAGPDCATFSVFPGVATTYSDGTCSPIAAVTPSGTSPVSGTIQSCVTLDASVPTYNGIPYVPRYYNLEPTTNPSTSTATITLYFTQADFNAYNAARGSFPALPTGPSDATGISNLTISQFHGTGTTPDTYVGASGTITPTSVTWDATNSRWDVTFSITGFSGFFVSGSSIVPLPLTLTAFSGVSTAAGNQLQWETSMEQNTAYFAVERQVAGDSSFQSIATVAAAGNSNLPRAYQYTDALTGVEGNSWSYRLKMVDLDGTFTYSRIITLSSAVNNGWSIRVTPNPFHQPVAITVSLPQASPATLIVTDVAGNRLAEQALVLQKGVTSLAPDLLTPLSPGVYFLSIITSQGKQTVKLIKE